MSQEAPLVQYREGRRVVLGTATVEDDGTVTPHFSDEVRVGTAPGPKVEMSLEVVASRPPKDDEGARD